MTQWAIGNPSDGEIGAPRWSDGEIGGRKPLILFKRYRFITLFQTCGPQILIERF